MLRLIQLTWPTFKSEFAACKTNPADASQVLAALPMRVNVDDYVQGDYVLDVLVADAVSGKVIARSCHEAAIVSDALKFSGVTLDTARYQLAPGLRAFGVRIRYTGSLRVNPLSSETLSLYVNDGSQLREILAEMLVSDSQGDWDGFCAGHFGEKKRTLAEDDCDDIEGKSTTNTFNPMNWTDRQGFGGGLDLASIDARQSIR
ncbi:hypothetical protein NP522_06565 [Pseudomonas guariconensis]|uniref:hypothetical protein n=1 Tax=Pseudomonas guariconensis TaxID=1288410 RepID=UPI002363B1D7|nr:hypothetical protein [Pseudomonas guariconensis]MDD2089851.1 hypothetical protein [Pseudomonas guariconensis]